jgi:CheY-like chemotaxis protein
VLTACRSTGTVLMACRSTVGGGGSTPDGGVACVAGRGCPSCRSGARSQDGHDGGVSLILILSNINMPGMSGLELLPKANALRPDVPVIMITAYGGAETKRKALESGAEALLTKPIDFLTLRAEIDLLVERAA